MSQVLLIEDDAGTAEEIALELRRAGHRLQHERFGRTALAAASAGSWNAIILDRMLPDIDGLEVVRRLRENGDRTPVLVLSALSDLGERVRGLDIGGDDYLCKPFALVELVARLEALLRRPLGAGETALRLGPIELDLLRRTAFRGERALELLPREFQLLEYLVRRGGRVVTRSMLLQDVWGYRFEPRSNVVDVHMGKLRHKVDLDDETPLIRSVRGQGYRIDAPG
ncbi:response regulator transcription factor [Jiella sp. M17.18]|uniref:response regulator transcription factor n=1 Tax=Jiella sp. M17.18 TaxID=3234247 RepID=UPI0034DE8352